MLLASLTTLPVGRHALRAGWGLALLAGLALACFPASGDARFGAAILHVDAMSLPFLLVLTLFGLMSGARDAGLACAALTVATGNPVLFCVGAAALVVLPRDPGGGPRGAPASGSWGVAAVALGTALLSGGDAWRLSVLPGPVLVAAAALMGLSPRPLSGARHVAPASVRDLAGLVAGCCLAVRMLVDWPAAPVGAAWGGGVAAVGLLAALAGGSRALTAPDAARVLSGLLAAWGGLGLLLVGLVVVGRADDLPLLALGAFRALVLLLGGVGMAMLAVLLVLRDIAAAAGPLALARAGGLAALMPRASGVLVLALAVGCGLPPLAGFAVLWLVVHSLLALPRAEGLAGEIAPLLVLSGVGLVSGLMMLATLRLVACVVLGRPRTPRAAGAVDCTAAALRAPLACLGVAGALSLLPGLWLWLTRAAGWQAAGLVRMVPSGAQPPWLGLAAPGGDGVFYPAGIVLLLLLAGGLVLAAARLAGIPASRPVAAWTEGAPPSPPWMPFGDAATQAGPALFVSQIDAILDATRPARGVVRRGMQAGRWCRRLGPGADGMGGGAGGAPCDDPGPAVDRGRGAGAAVGPAMIGLLLGCVLLAVHVTMMVALAPVVRGVVAAGVAQLGGDRPMPVRMRWRRLLALARQRGLRAAGMADVMPALALAASVAACVLVPSFALGLPGSGLSDLLLVAGLLVLVRLALLGPALAAGQARSGRAAAGTGAALAVMQAVFPLVVAGAVLATGHGGIDAILTRMHTRT